MLRAEDEEEVRRAQHDALEVPRVGLGGNIGGSGGINSQSTGMAERAKAGRRRVRTRNKSMRNRTGETQRRPLPKVAITKN